MATTAILKIQLDIEGGQKLNLSVKNLADLKAAIKAINAERINIDPRSPNFVQASNQLKTLQGLYKGLSKDANSAEQQISEAQAQLNKPPAAIGYYRQLQAQLVVLTNQYKDLSQAEAQGKLGQGLARQINAISTNLKAQDASLNSFQRNIGNYKDGLLSIGNIVSGGLIAGGIAGIASAAVNFGKESLKAIDEQLKADAQLKAAIKSTAGIAGKSLSELKAQADDLQKVTLFSDDQTQGAQGLLLTFTNIRGEIFDRTVPAVQDLATAFHQDLETSAKQVGKALNDPIKGVGALSKAGVQFSVEQKKMIKSLVETGDLAGAQTLILKELETQVGGSARAAALAGAGPFQLLKLQFGEIQESVGKLLLGGLTGFLDTMQDVTQAALDFVSVPLSEELGNQQAEFDGLIGVLQDTTTEETQRVEIIKQLKANYPDYLKFVNDDAKGQIDLAATLEFGNKLFEQRILLESTQEQRGKLVRERIELEQKLTKELVRQNQLKASGSSDIRIEGQPTGGGGLDRQNELVATIRGKITGLNTELADLVKTSDETSLRTTGKTIAELSAQLSGVGKATDKAGKATKAKKVEDLGAADSIARLTKRVSELQDALSKAPQSGIAKATKDLVLAEQALARAKAKEAEARNPSPNLTEVQQAEAGLVSLGVSIDNPANAADAKEQLDKLATELAGSVGVTMPVDIDQDQARKDFEIQKYFLDQENKIKEENAAKEKKRKEDQHQQEQEFLDAGLNAASNFNNQLAAQENARIDAQLQKQNEALQTEFDGKRAAAQGNAAIIANLDKQQKEKQIQAEKAAARQRQAIARKEATIAYFLELIKSGGNPVKIAAATAAYIAGLIGIQAQQFYAGGVAKDIENQQGVVKSANMKPTRHGDNRVAFLKVGERVLTKDNQAAIEEQYGAGIWRNIGAKDPNSIFGARHGSMMPPTYGAGRSILNVNTSLSREDIGHLSRAIAQTNDRMAGVVKSAMVEGAKYAERERKATKTH